MKKFLSLALSAALLCSLGAPALAAEPSSVEARLAAVTERVKTALGLDTSAYESFTGELVEGAAVPSWNLRWSGKEEELAIVATENGKILNYNRFADEPSADYPRQFGPSFPTMTREQARETALAFLAKALTPGVESAVIHMDEPAGSLSATGYMFSGEILENGLPSPFRFTINVRVADNAVTNFYTMGDYTEFMGGIPSSVPAADAAKAGESLKATLKLRLEYVLQEDGKTAVLRYLPESTHSYYVDAQTGKLVDLTELERELWENGRYDGATGGASAPSAAPDSGKENALTQAEQEGIAKLEGVLSKVALDAAARKLTALGLSKYTLSNADYRVDQETGEVSAALQYAYKSGDRVYRRNVTLSAKTGVLLSVNSSRPWKDGEKPSITEAAAQTKAEAFLKSVCPDQFARTARYDKRDADNTSVVYSFQYAAKENGYFLPDSSISVRIDGTDGSVSAYYNNYVPGVSFQSPEGIVDLNAALNSWFKTYDVTLSYLAVPEKLDLSEPQWKPLIEMGRSYLYTQKLAYALERDDWYLGVDAKTGEAIKSEECGESAITYSDIGGHWVKAQAEKLAQYGVGWTGGSLRPGQALTQLDLVALLVSTSGYRYQGDSGDTAETDQLYNMAYSMGILQKADRNDTAPVTRAQLVKLLLDSAGYGNIAGLEGIFKCSFSDERSIPAEYYGYAAVAQGLGLVKGGSGGTFAPNRIANRAEAVSMLYNFMSR